MSSDHRASADRPRGPGHHRPGGRRRQRHAADTQAEAVAVAVATEGPPGGGAEQLGSETHTARRAEQGERAAGTARADGIHGGCGVQVALGERGVGL